MTLERAADNRAAKSSTSCRQSFLIALHPLLGKKKKKNKEGGKRKGGNRGKRGVLWNHRSRMGGGVV